MVSSLFAIIFSYLLGSIPTAYIAGRMVQGIDIRQHGSGNVGATNTFRVLGKGYGIIVLLIDILKGLLAVVMVGDIFQVPIYMRIVLGLFAVIGHNWTLFLQFKGGKGIATTLGVLIGLSIKVPSIGMVLLACIVTWGLVFLVTGYVSLASIIAAVLLPVALLATNHAMPWILLGVIFCLLVVIRHKPNIKRLLEGKESQVNFPFRKKKH